VSERGALKELEARIAELETRFRERPLGRAATADEQTHGCTHGCTADSCPDTDGCTFDCTYECTHGCTAGGCALLR